MDDNISFPVGFLLVSQTNERADPDYCRFQQHCTILSSLYELCKYARMSLHLYLKHIIIYFTIKGIVKHFGNKHSLPESEIRISCLRVNVVLMSYWCYRNNQFPTHQYNQYM